MNQRIAKLAAVAALLSMPGSPGPSSMGEGYPASDMDRAAKKQARLARREKLVAKAEAKRARKAQRRTGGSQA